MKIHKVQLPIAFGQVEIDLPIDAKILACREQGNVPTIWFTTAGDMETKPATFLVMRTGEEVNPLWTHIGTCLFEGGSIIAHIFWDDPYAWIKRICI